MLKRFRQSNRPTVADAAVRKTVRTAAPILLRFVGCADEPVTVNGEFFTLGDGRDDTVALPTAMRPSGSAKLRFTRGAEGWRAVAADNRLFFVNQRVCRGLTSLESGDLVRFEAGGAGVQFLVRSQPETGRTSQATKPAEADAVESPKESGVTRRHASLRRVLITLAVLGAIGLAYYAGVSSAPAPTAPPVSDQP